MLVERMSHISYCTGLERGEPTTSVKLRAASDGPSRDASVFLPMQGVRGRVCASRGEERTVHRKGQQKTVWHMQRRASD